MCGLAAVVNKEDGPRFLFEALKKMEYRGYDSWGMATMNGSVFNVSRRLGAVSEASPDWYEHFCGKTGIAHTRWAQQGRVSIENTHPIEGGYSSAICQVVHNGIIENYHSLRQTLERAGYTFKTETDTEVVGHLFDFYMHWGREVKIRDFQPVSVNWALDCWLQLVRGLKGSYALAMITSFCPDTVFLAANGSPLLISDLGYAASDPQALRGYDDDCFSLPDRHVAVMTPGLVYVMNEKGESVSISDLILLEDAEEAGGDVEVGSFMEKEIFEQPDLIRNLALIPPSKRESFERVLLFGCGSSYNAALLGKHYFRQAGILTQVESSTEIVEDEDLFEAATHCVALTQSGETKDTINAVKVLHEHKDIHARTRLITNVKGSTADRMIGHTLYLECGPEYGVAATKTFTMQCIRLFQMAHPHMHYGTIFSKELSGAIEQVLAKRDEVSEFANELTEWEHILYLGRGLLYPIALEGALKMKEVAYKHAEAIHAAEMKHGPIALIDDETLSLFLLTKQDDEYLDKVKNNISEIRARAGTVFLIGDKEAVEKVGDMAERVLIVPSVRAPLQPLVVNVALQLLAYFAATLQGINPDKPRNLCKSVSVE